jgi:hypothetical protein
MTGPALIVEPQTTTLLSADFTASIDAGGNIVMERGAHDPPETRLQVMWNRLLAVVEEQGRR